MRQVVRRARAQAGPEGLQAGAGQPGEEVADERQKVFDAFDGVVLVEAGLLYGRAHQEARWRPRRTT